MVTYCAELNDISWSTKIIKIITVSDLFYRIVNYWNSVNRTVVNDYACMMIMYDHYVCRKLSQLSSFVCEHVQDFHLLLGDLFNI